MSLQQFQDAWIRTGGFEKGYVNDPADSGGETIYGITVAVARAHGYTGEMKDMKVAVATNIAKQAYWDVLMLDDVAMLSAKVADKLFDMSILCGQPTAAGYFQQCLNLFNRSDSDKPVYPDIKEDYRIGKLCIYALSLLARARPKEWEAVMLRALNSLEGAHFIDICRTQLKNEKFVFGWFLNRVG
jgi:lysozyme family protein